MIKSLGWRLSETKRMSEVETESFLEVKGGKRDSKSIR